MTSTPSHAEQSPAKPILRGVLHQYGFFVSLVLGCYIIAISDSHEQTASIIYALSICCLLGTSAIYHRIDWSPAKKIWIGGLDRAMIIVLIAGSYTPYGILILEGEQNDIVFWSLWVSVIVGTLLNFAWTNAPNWLRTLFYVGVAWIGASMTPQMTTNLGMDCMSFVFAGGVLYTVGGMFYATKKPDLIPGVFGYHELFHAFVLVAMLLHYLAVVLYVLN